MNTDYKTTTTYFIVILTFVYSVIIQNVSLVSILVFPLIIMWGILKTNSKELVRDLVDALKHKWSK